MARQFLSFYLQDALYAVDVSQVQEILEYSAPVRLPCTIEYVEGLISSRGEGISVVNLRTKFNMNSVEPTKDTRIIILEIAKSETINEETVQSIIAFGAIVDGVEEVIEIDDSYIEDAPKFGNTIPGEYIRGIGKKDDKFIIILDMDKVFSFEEIIALKGVR